jgi:hypothetical protein
MKTFAFEKNKKTAGGFLFLGTFIDLNNFSGIKLTQLR